MTLFNLRNRHFLAAPVKYDIKASTTVFFVALPLCLGISLASGVPVQAGLWAGIVGGILVPLASGSPLSVSGPAAGLTAISAMAIVELGSIRIFFLSVAIAGLLQILLGISKLGGFTHLIPSSVIKGMLAAIGVILISKQVPLLIGYDKPDFWQEELFNLLTFHHGFEHVSGLSEQVSPGVVLITVCALIFVVVWEKKIVAHVPLPASFAAVLVGSTIGIALKLYVPEWALKTSQYVFIPHDVLDYWELPVFSALFDGSKVWESAVIICLIASLETLLSIEALDKIDRQNRTTPQNRELVAQGLGNLVSGLGGGIPITSVIVRSAANVESGARSKLSCLLHGLWLLLTVLFATDLVNQIPYCVLAVILIRTGYSLAKPAMIIGVYKQGREQFLPFSVTVVAILITDLLVGVLIGISFAIYFLIKHTYRAGFTMTERMQGHINHVHIELALNVTFLNKKRFMELLDAIPEYSVVCINGAHSVYIDNDVLEIFQAFQIKAKQRHIELELRGIPETPMQNIH